MPLLRRCGTAPQSSPAADGLAQREYHAGQQPGLADIFSRQGIARRAKDRAQQDTGGVRAVVGQALQNKPGAAVEGHLFDVHVLVRVFL